MTVFYLGIFRVETIGEGEIGRRCSFLSSFIAGVSHGSQYPYLFDSLYTIPAFVMAK
jgi:hypothetical protein